MGTELPLCKNQEKEEEDWDGNHQNQVQTQPQQKIQMPQARCSQTLNYQRPQNFQKCNQDTSNDEYLSQSKFHKQWEVEIEKPNAKYNLGCFSGSELDSKSDEGESNINMNMGMKHSFNVTLCYSILRNLLLYFL